GDVAGRPRLVLDDHRVPRQWPQLLGEEAYEHVGAAAGREPDNQADVLVRIVLGTYIRHAGAEAGQRHQPGCKPQTLSCDDHVSVLPSRRPQLRGDALLMSAVPQPCGSILAMRTYSPHSLIAVSNISWAFSGVLT